MALHYSIKSNPLQRGTYFIQTMRGRKIPLSRLITNIQAETTLSDTDIKAVINALIGQVTTCLLDGDEPVIDGLVSFSTTVRESFEQADVSATEAATINVKAKVDHRLAKQVKDELRLEKVSGITKLPTLTAVYDVATNQQNRYTPGNILKIHGTEMKFDPTEAEEGVFFVAETNGQAVRAQTYAQVGSKEIIVLVPTGITGNQQVEVRTRYQGSRLRAGQLMEIVAKA